MDYSSAAEMTCILKMNTKCEGCKAKVIKILRNIRGVYNVNLDGEQGTMRVAGRVNPNTLLGVLEKYGKHAEVKYLNIDGEVIGGYGHGHGHAPYGMECSYPQHQYFPAGLSFPPPVPSAPPLSHMSLPLSSPLAPSWAPPPPPYLVPFWTPNPLRPAPPPTLNRNVRTRRNHCALM